MLICSGEVETTHKHMYVCTFAVLYICTYVWNAPMYVCRLLASEYSIEYIQYAALVYT